MDFFLFLKSLTAAAGELLDKGYDLVGPVAPVMYGIGLLKGTLFLFLLTLLLLVSRDRWRDERAFLLYLEKGSSALSNIAIVLGFVGTYLGLMETLPVLAEVVKGEAGSKVVGDLLSGLSSAFVSSMVGLALGGIGGSVNGYLFGIVTSEIQGTGVTVRQGSVRARGERLTSSNRHVKTAPSGLGSSERNHDQGPPGQVVSRPLVTALRKEVNCTTQDVATGSTPNSGR